MRPGPPPMFTVRRRRILFNAGAPGIPGSPGRRVVHAAAGADRLAFAASDPTNPEPAADVERLRPGV